MICRELVSSTLRLCLANVLDSRLDVAQPQSTWSRLHGGDLAPRRQAPRTSGRCLRKYEIPLMVALAREQAIEQAIEAESSTSQVSNRAVPSKRLTELEDCPFQQYIQAIGSSSTATQYSWLHETDGSISNGSITNESIDGAIGPPQCKDSKSR